MRTEGRKETRGRPALDYTRAPKAQDSSGVVQRIVLRDGYYEQRYTRCGRGCNRCLRDRTGFDPVHPGHGPYWYRIIRRAGGQIVRRYEGKELMIVGRATAAEVAEGDANGL